MTISVSTKQQAQEGGANSNAPTADGKPKVKAKIIKNRKLLYVALLAFIMPVSRIWK